MFAAQQREFTDTELIKRVAEILPRLEKACGTQSWDLAAQLLGELAELTRAIPVGVLPMEILANIVDQMQAMLSEPSPFPPHELALLALRLELQSAMEMGMQDPSPVLAAVCHVLGQQDLLLKLVHEPEIAAALAAALGCFSECIGTLPPGVGDSIIARLAGLFDGAIGQHPANVILAPEIFHVLRAFVVRGQYDPGLPVLILGRLDRILQHLTQLDNLEIAKALAATLRYFSECVPHLPEGWLAENFSKLVAPAIGQMQNLFDAAIEQHPANVILAPEIFHVLCAFVVRGYPAPGLPDLIFGCLNRILQHLTQLDNLEIAKALAAILKHFSGCVGKLPSGTARIDEIIPWMQQLFDLTCNLPGRERIALEALHIVVLLAIKTNAVSVALDVMLRLLSMPTADFAFRNRCIAADILKNLNWCIVSLPSGADNQLILQIRELCDSEVGNLGPLAREAFHVLCAFAARGQYDPGHILEHLQALVAHDDADALAATLGYFSECVPHLPEGWLAENFSELVAPAIGQMQNLFDGAIGQYPANVILAPEIFHVLCAFVVRGYPAPGLPDLILGCLNRILQHLTQLDNLEIAKALAATLEYFSECIPHLPYLPEENCNNLIAQMQRLFGPRPVLPTEDVQRPVLSTRERVALEALHIVVLLAIKTNAATLAYKYCTTFIVCTANRIVLRKSSHSRNHTRGL